MRTRIWLSCALTAALAVGCTSDPAPRSIEEPERPPEVEQVEPEPEPLQDVEGTVDEVVVTDLSVTESGLYRDGSEGDAPVPIDQAAIDAAVAEATAWLDTHITDVQSGGSGNLEDVALSGDPADVAGGLANPDHPVVSASYLFTIGALGVPEWVRVSVTVTREDGVMPATFVFLPEGDGLSLLAINIGEGTPAPAAETTPDDDAPDDEAPDDTEETA
ncbi:hypothetical protein [Nitriliruptor alkaliphilus]|uniref:hypothetical protein n=1 Tax=Nitriliruptor alkaliphilus TaxID=427918 RepID=UPI0006977116|nr:hypothetical protein [Nitriliruptor alkaliphilus]